MRARGRTALIATVLATAVATAVARDGEKPDGAKPASPPASTPPAKKERKTSKEAEAAIAKYASLLHFPSTKYKTVEMNSHAYVQMAGGEIGCKFNVKEDGTVAIDVSVSDAAMKQFGPQAKSIKDAIKKQVEGIFRPFLVPMDVTAKQYDLAFRADKDKSVVEMTRFADAAAWDKLVLTFGADGLLEKQVGVPNVDPNDQMGAMYAGVEIETKVEHKKRGDRFTIESATISDPMGESSLKASYYEIPDAAPLPKELVFASPLVGEITVSVHDFVLDGKKIAGTERKDETKPATPPAKPSEPTKPADPAKSGK